MAIKVAEAIGVLLTVVLLIAGWPLGVWLVRAEGRAAWRRLRAAAIITGRPPGREVLDGALILLGGSLLIVPGFITDVLGLLLLLPPTRWLARIGLVRNFQSRLVLRATRFGGPRAHALRRRLDRDRHQFRSPAPMSRAESRPLRLLCFGDATGEVWGASGERRGRQPLAFGTPDGTGVGHRQRSSCPSATMTMAGF